MKSIANNYQSFVGQLQSRLTKKTGIKEVDFSVSPSPGGEGEKKMSGN